MFLISPCWFQEIAALFSKCSLIFHIIFCSRIFLSISVRLTDLTVSDNSHAVLFNIWKMTNLYVSGRKCVTDRTCAPASYFFYSQTQLPNQKASILPFSFFLIHFSARGKLLANKLERGHEILLLIAKIVAINSNSPEKHLYFNFLK